MLFPKAAASQVRTQQHRPLPWLMAFSNVLPCVSTESQLLSNYGWSVGGFQSPAGCHVWGSCPSLHNLGISERSQVRLALPPSSVAHTPPACPALCQGKTFRRTTAQASKSQGKPPALIEPIWKCSCTRTTFLTTSKKQRSHLKSQETPHTGHQFKQCRRSEPFNNY